MMSPEELIRIKLNNVLQTYLSKPITTKMLSEMERACKEILDDHSDVIEGSVSVILPWQELSWLKRFWKRLTGDTKLRTQVSVTVEVHEKEPANIIDTKIEI